MTDFNSDQVREHEVRRLPRVRIGSGKVAELRATAALTATIRAVADLGACL